LYRIAKVAAKRGSSRKGLEIAILLDVHSGAQAVVDGIP
jgi:hypothetical protein